MTTASGRQRKRVGAAIAAIVGLDELVLTVGLVLITVALWPLAGRLALIVPGSVLLWIGMPPRAPFVDRSAPGESPARRTKWVS